ncbi:hypothetical protein K439DRAFT_1564678 [Ramaria rubella]|nr:hypothetical protein K439DRAFT_1564678 [Ramaria rubella]
MQDVAMISSATKQLPDSICRIMRGRTTEATTWREWTEALRQLTAEEINDEQRIYDAIEFTQSHQTDMGMQISQLYTQGNVQTTPMRQNWQSRASPNTSPVPRYQPLLTASPQAPTTPVTPLQSTPTPFTLRTRQTKSNEQQPPPDTPMNRARVARLCEEWLVANLRGTAHAGSNYPLSPGTAAAAVDTCSRSGKPETETHNMFSCQNEPLDMKEQQYRRNVYAKSRFNRTPNMPGSSTPLFYVGMEAGEKKEIGEEELWLIIENSEAGKGTEVEN